MVQRPKRKDVLELDPEEVQVIGQPLSPEKEKPIRQGRAAENMDKWLSILSAELGVPAISSVHGAGPEAVSPHLR